MRVDRPAIADERWAVRAFVGVGVLASAYYLAIGRRLWFVNDEWDFLAKRTAGNFGDLFRPHNSHWNTLPILVYRLLWWTFGIRTYFPYQALIVALHLLAAWLVRVVMRRAGVGPWTATATATVLVLFGGGQQDIIWAFQIGYVGALVLGLTHLLLADHDGPLDRRDWLGLAARHCGDALLERRGADGDRRRHRHAHPPRMADRGRAHRAPRIVVLDLVVDNRSRRALRIHVGRDHLVSEGPVRRHHASQRVARHDFISGRAMARRDPDGRRSRHRVAPVHLGRLFRETGSVEPSPGHSNLCRASRSDGCSTAPIPADSLAGRDRSGRDRHERTPAVAAQEQRAPRQCHTVPDAHRSPHRSSARRRRAACRRRPGSCSTRDGALRRHVPRDLRERGRPLARFPQITFRALPASSSRATRVCGPRRR